ncbi:hypothetical protein PHMEG_00026938 [Phytophthora megakarya]|uniref:Uncharacterized protein n=1 Tax=Phytophthora megakarya TaxID=4795 RepID=A0A225V9K3_9STRA|nr:hypothetical protein PHMEG_00026938 [Phytophthora megakarya]
MRGLQALRITRPSLKQTTSDFLTQQATLGSQDAMWIADLNATRLGFGTAQGLLGVQVPTALIEARQCAALLQTFLFEAGFQFDNVIPEWFRTRASKISADSEVIQCLLSIEFIEWNKLTDGIHYEVRAVSGTVTDGEPEDVWMTDTEAGLLDESFLNQHRFRVRTARSFQGPSDGEPQLKRQQNAPPRPPSSIQTSLSSGFTLPTSSELKQFKGSRSRTLNPGDRQVPPKGAQSTLRLESARPMRASHLQ